MLQGHVEPDPSDIALLAVGRFEEAPTVFDQACPEIARVVGQISISVVSPERVHLAQRRDEVVEFKDHRLRADIVSLAVLTATSGSGPARELAGRHQ